jgi:hypothetical protein
MNMCFWRQANALPNTSDAQKNAIVNAMSKRLFFSPRRFGHGNVYIYIISLYITHWYILIMTHSILNYVHVCDL